MSSLVEIDALDIQVIIDNELDPISPPSPDTVQVTGGLMGHIALFNGPALPSGERGNAVKELRMDNICCSAHGLSIMVTATRGDIKRTVLFDTGPEEDVWERNAKRLGADVSQIDLIVLSHWHRDHSGGMLKAIKIINQARKDKSAQEGKIAVDLHPSRPDFRGFLMGEKIISLEADPSFEEIAEQGATVNLHSDTHTVLDDMFLVSGEIPRETSYEQGVKFGMRFDKADAEWFSDEKIIDERFLMCNLKGKGIVLFTGCSHAGVVNSCRHALNLLNDSDDIVDTSHTTNIPLHAVVGGYHLATSHDAKAIEPTVKDLEKLDPAVLMPGHCTGWRAKFAIEQQMPGRLAPCAVGMKYAF